MPSSKKSYQDEIKELKSQVEFLKKIVEESSAKKLEDNIEELNEQITKMVSININLQSKMTELLIKVTDLIRENRELVNLLEEASEEEEEEGPDWNSILVELKKIEKNTADFKEANSKLVEYIKKMYTKNLLAKAIKGADAGIPIPSEKEVKVGEL